MDVLYFDYSKSKYRTSQWVTKTFGCGLSVSMYLYECHVWKLTNSSLGCYLSSSESPKEVFCDHYYWFGAYINDLLYSLSAIRFHLFANVCSYTIKDQTDHITLQNVIDNLTNCRQLKFNVSKYTHFIRSTLNTSQYYIKGNKIPCKPMTKDLGINHKSINFSCLYIQNFTLIIKTYSIPAVQAKNNYIRTYFPELTQYSRLWRPHLIKHTQKNLVIATKYYNLNAMLPPIQISSYHPPLMYVLVQSKQYHK